MTIVEHGDASLKLFSLADFATQPTIRWLVRDIIPADSFVVVFGEPKGGKTFTVLDLLMHSAHGMAWCGHSVSRPLRVAFLSGEGQSGLRVRIHAWLRHHNAAALAGAFMVLPVSLPLTDRIVDLIEVLETLNPDVIAIDTLNAYFGTGDENSTKDMTMFVAALRRLRETLRCSIVILHHTGLADTRRERGSGALRGAADVVIRVAPDGTRSGCIGFKVDVGRDIEPMDEPIALQLRPVATDWIDEDGQFISTCIVEPSRHSVTMPGRGVRSMGKAQVAILAIARELASTHTPDAAGWVTLSRALITAQARLRGLSRQSVNSAWKPLQARRHLILTDSDAVGIQVAQSTCRAGVA